MDHYSRTSFESSVANEYWSRGSDTLLILLPGLGYTNQMPIMFYVHEMAMARNWDILMVNYDYRGVPREELGARFLPDIVPIIESALAARNYGNVVLAGKSIGTRVMSSLLNHGFDRATALIWLTPLLVNEDVLRAIVGNTPGIAVFGDADFAVEGVDLAPLEMAGIPQIVVPHGDHSLDTPGDIPGSIRALADVMQQLDAWLAATVPHSSSPDRDPLELLNAQLP